MKGFVGPRDIFRNPDALFRQFEPTNGHKEGPFDLVLTNSGDDFAIMNSMHFKLGLYEHQSASAIEGVINLISKHYEEILMDGKVSNLKKIKIVSYEPAFSIIGDPAKMKPTTR